MNKISCINVSKTFFIENNSIKVLDNINLRDELDSTRKDSPLLKSNDAIEFDNSQLSQEQQFEKIMELVNSCLQL